MTSRRLNRDELAKIVGGDPRAIRAFERILRDVQANIAGPSTITLNYNSNGTLASPLPVAAQFTLNTESGALTSGVSWGVTVTSGSFSSAPTIGGTGAGNLLINGGLVSVSATLVITARIDGRGYPPFSVSVVRSTIPPDTPGGGGTASDSTSTFTPITSGAFAPITRELMITLPAGDTDANLTAGGLTLAADNASPVSASTVEIKWQRETAPSVWSDVGSAAISSPDPIVTDIGGDVPFFFATPGLITCNRTQTGMPAGSAQKFRIVGRISAGTIRTIYVTGTAASVQG